MNELEKLCLPLISYLKENHNPYTEIVIKMDSVEVKQNIDGIPINKG